MAVVCTVALLGVSVASAHTSVGVDHMGEVTAVCMAILVGGAAVAGLPDLGLRAPLRRSPLGLGALPTLPRLQPVVRHAARGDPAVLQVFRR